MRATSLVKSHLEYYAFWDECITNISRRVIANKRGKAAIPVIVLEIFISLEF